MIYDHHINVSFFVYEVISIATIHPMEVVFTG